jgi:hypothetical protein
VSGKCREKCKRIRRKVAGGGLRPGGRWEEETDRECPRSLGSVVYLEAKEARLMNDGKIRC